MGQAKRRGTFEQRLALALEKQVAREKIAREQKTVLVNKPSSLVSDIAQLSYDYTR